MFIVFSNISCDYLKHQLISLKHLIECYKNVIITHTLLMQTYDYFILILIYFFAKLDGSN